MIGRWAIPLSILLPTIVSLLEWVTLGGLSPFHTHIWAYWTTRADFPLTNGYLDGWMESDKPFDLGTFAGTLLGNIDWTQMAVGWAFAVVVIYFASEYRRRRNDN